MKKEAVQASIVQISNPGRTVNDGVKITFNSKTIVNDLLSLGVKVLTPLEEATGEIHFPKFAEYRTLRFKISKSNRVEISGSLHKCWTAKFILKNEQWVWEGENYSDFTFGQLCECISDLCHKFNINPLEARLHLLEFGLNVSPVFNPFEFCGRVIAFKKESFSKFRTTGKTKLHIGFEAAQQQYTVKVYDKGKQYYKSENILRYEVRVTKMKFLKSAGIYFLSDLLKPETHLHLGRILNEIFAELIIKEMVNASELTANELRIYTLCTNPKEWEGFTAKQRYKKKIQFQEIVKAKGQTHWKETTAKLINDKWGMLLALDSRKCGDVLTEPQTLNSGDKLTDLIKTEKGLFNPLDNPLNTPRPALPGLRTCKTCGEDISHQHPNSLFCSAKFVGEAQAHKCRNVDSNPRNNFRSREKRRYGDGQTLFGLNDLLS